MSKPLFSLLLLSLLFMNSNSSTNSPSKICSPRDCGNGVNISYPFWLLDNTTSEQYYCGYRNFGLNCSADGKPILSLSNNTFYVENINYTDYTLTLVDIDLANQTCPRPRQNLTLDTVPLDYSPLDLNLTFYFNCTSALSLSSADAIQCLESGANRSYVSEVESKTDVFDWVGICEEKVVVTVMQEEINVDDLISELDGAMKKGFVLNWSMAEDCATCESSDGHCGYSDTAEELLCFCQGGTVSKNHCNVGEGILLWFKLLIGIGSAIVGILLIWISICCFRRKVSSNSMVFWRGRTKSDQTIEAFIRNYGSLAPKRYTYSEVKKMTSSFIYKLGQGGYGNVYKGKLINGCPVAVKVLKASKGNGEEFINEVASISRTSHVNVVTLLGFCIEGHKRALIYEFMPNGSLEKFIYNENPLKIGRQLGWEKLQQIAIGIARGLEYLHRGCNTRILHFDIKPHNILLDEAFCPKISDFGLAKLCSKKESIISMLGTRGTIGYIAPEVFSRNFGGVSHKSDVYSYGMMVLEMVGGRKNIDVGVAGAGHTSEIYFPHWVYKRLELDNNLRLQGDMSEEDNMIARKMVIVGLWCIQTHPSHRPSMSEVMNMLEGSIDDLQIPPKPYLSSPPRSPANPSTFSTVSIS